MPTKAKTKTTKAKSSTKSTQSEEFNINSEKLVAKVKELIKEGNARRIIIKNPQGKTLIEIPLTIGVVGAALIPVWAALGAIAALVAKCTIVVERDK